MNLKTSAVLRIFQKELIHIKRGNTLPRLLIPPILQLVVFGYVFTNEVNHIPLMVVDRDVSSYSRLLIDKFSNNEYFDLKYICADKEEIQKALTKGDIKCVLSIPEDFSKRIKKGEGAKVQLLTDGTNSNIGGAAVSYGNIIIYNFSQEIFRNKIKQFERAIGHIPNVGLEERVWFNPELKSSDTMVPGIIAQILLIVTMTIASLSLVREKEYGNIEQLMVTPIKPYELLLGKVLPYVIIGFIDIVFITVAGILIFNVPFKGNFAFLLLISLIPIFVNLGLGIFISTISSTQQQATISTVFFLMPSIILSGFVFPIKNMPQILQYITYILPPRYYIVILRGIFLKGSTFTELLPQVAALCIYAVVIFTFAVSRFKKTVG